MTTAPSADKRAALLSFVWPGLGQARRGKRRLALIQASPQLVAAALLLLALVWLRPIVIFGYLLNPVVSLSLLALVTVLAVWHAWSIGDAVGWPRGRKLSSAEMPSVSTRLWATLLIGLVLLIHTWLGYNLVAFYRTSTTIYRPPPTVALSSPAPTDLTSPSPFNATPSLAPGQTPASDPSGISSPPLPNGRVTVLFVGIDNTHGDLLALTDTLMVASFDPSDGSLAMISVPRDTAHLPFYRGGTFLPRINALRQRATQDPASYPDGPTGTLVNEMSFILGIPIDYYAEVGINGFSQLIDELGGVDIDVPTAVDDPGYPLTPTHQGFHVDPGPNHFDGTLATAYARSRHGSSDYARAARQQQLLLALRKRLGDPLLLTRLPQVLDAASQIVRTDVPLDRLPQIISIIESTTLVDSRNVVLKPPDYASGVRSILGLPTDMNQLNMGAVAQLSIKLFGSDSRYAR